MELNLCDECGTPELITGEHRWLNNGDIVHTRAQASRILFIETESLDPLFHNIAQIIGIDIEHMVITAARRALRIYLEAFIPRQARELVQKREVDFRPIVELFFDVARLDGVGAYELVDVRTEGDRQDYAVVRIKEPHSVPLSVSHIIAATECLTGVDQGYQYRQVSPYEIQITAAPSPHPEEMKKRMWTKAYSHREGDVELERCDTCGGPGMLSEYRWQPEKGIIINTSTNRRMAISGNDELDPVFEELESELGDAVPRAVVEAQRRFTRSGFFTSQDITYKGDFRTQLAMRGLGNLKELEMKKTGMKMVVKNVALPLIVVGLSQGFFEMGFRVDDTAVEWELSNKGDLQLEVKPLR